MPNFTLYFHGGKPGNAAEGRARQPRWNEWFSKLGDKVVDPGAAAFSLGIVGSSSGFEGLPPITGYTVIAAASEIEAMDLASTCPIYSEGGVVEVGRHVTAAQILA